MPPADPKTAVTKAIRKTLEQCAALCRNISERDDALDAPRVMDALHNVGEAEACAVAIEALLKDLK